MNAPFLLMIVSLLVPAQDAPQTAIKEELQRLQGTWKTLTGEKLGRKVDIKELGIDQLVIKGDRMTLRGDGMDKAEFRITIDPSHKPKHMDWRNEKEKESLPVIYAIEGKKLTMCFPMLKSEPIPKPHRPQSFETKDKPLGMIIAERTE